MKNSNEIQDIFQKLENGESRDLSKKEAIWEKLEGRLDQNQEEKKVVPFPIWKTMGIAASIALLIGVGFFLFKNQNGIPNPTETPQTITKVKTGNSENSSASAEELVNRYELEESEKSEQELKVSNNSGEKSIQKSDKEWVILPKTTMTELGVLSDSIKFLSGSSYTLISDFIPNDEIKEGKITSAPQSDSTKIRGILQDEFGPIADAEVIVRGKNTTVITDEMGKFEVDANIGDVLAVIDAMGNSQYYKVTKENLGTLKFEQTIALQTVTIVGGVKLDPAQKVGSYSVVKSEDIQSKGYSSTISKPISSVDDVLNGRIAGINLSNGQSNSSNQIKIRGVSSLNNMKDPLYVIDGIVVRGKNLKNINPNQIKNVSILKDASATALYGARGANGVIMIETKKGLTKKQIRELEKMVETDGKEIPEISAPPIEVNNEEYSSFIENKFESPKMNPLSTFSVDVDKAAYSNIRRFLNNGQKVPKDAVRIEEMINYFPYKYPQPTGQHPFSIHTEYSDAPWNPGHKLVKIGLQGKNLPVESLPNSNLVFLIDVSGSMEDPNKLPLLKKSFELLVNNLREKDRVSIVVYAGAAGMVLPPTSGSEKTTILEALNKLSAGGSTAGAAGIELAYQLAEQNFIQGGNNRVILATDGDFNVGRSGVKDLESLIAEKRKTGIFLTCLGYGMGNYKDNRMETLANKGNGNYAYIDNLQEANKFLVKEFSGTLYAIAKDVKIQIEFNPNLVQAYRLIGYETRLLNDEDFANDAIDAGEIGAGHQVTAFYEIVPMGAQSNYVEKPQDLKYSTYSPKDEFQNELATVKFRYKKPDGDKSIEMIHPISNYSKPLNSSSEDFKFASSVAWFGLKLRDSEFIQIKEASKISELAKQAQKEDSEGYKAEFIRIVELVK
jgi:Ca-activated chloride channel family protein